MTTTTYTKIVRTIGFLFIIAGVFVAGAYAGTQTVVAKIINPAKPVDQIPLSETVDLSEFWDVWETLEKKYPFKVSVPENTAKVYGAITGLVASYGDPYTVFFPPKEAKLFNDQVKGSFGGVGMEVGNKEGIITVIAPMKNSPAEQAGIQAGDAIVTINDTSTDGMSIDDAINLIRGEVGTQVTLGIYRKTFTEIQSFTITRAIVTIPTLETETRGDVFIISLYSFSENSARLFKEALQSFIASGSKKLIIDLRNNPGGYLDASVDIASYFLPSGKPIVREHAGEGTREIVYSSKGYTLIKDQPEIIILINQGSASASEILAGALMEHKSATSVGTQTFGKGSVQELVHFPDASSLKVTVAKWFTPKGVSISEKGITPDVVITEKPVKNPKTGKYSDPQMDAALKLLK